MNPTPEERAQKLCIRLNLYGYLDELATEIRAAVDAALEEAAQKIERLRGCLETPNRLVENLRKSARSTIPLVQANVAQSMWYIPLELCAAADEIERLRAREAKWRELREIEQELQAHYEVGGLDEQQIEVLETHAAELRRELGMDAEEKA